MKLQKNFIYYQISLFLISLFFLTCSGAQTKESSPELTGTDTTEKTTKEEIRKTSPKSLPSPASGKKVDTKGSSGVSDGESYDEDTKPSPSNSNIQSDSGLKAGFADDNKQFNLFLNFLEKFKSSAAHIPLNIKERIILTIKDNKGRCIPNANILIQSNGKTLTKGTSFADGSFLFFPSLYPEVFSYNVKVSKENVNTEISLDRQGGRTKDITLNLEQSQTSDYPLDILFILDTTGSMGEEIQRLKSTIEVINMNLAGNSQEKVQFGMVLYRDKREEYITKIIPFTSDLEKFKKDLNLVQAGGGGDYPEDLQSALKESMKNLQWRQNAIKLSFIITDAPPHLDYGQEYTYISAVKEASEKGIKLFSIGTGGLDINGEYVLRQISQFTKAKYIFLTYGEKGESDGGKEGSVSHHTGANFPTDKLESIVIRFAKEELQAAKGKPLESGEEYFTANKINSEKKEETLNKLFDKSISQLIDYSTFSIKPSTTISILPFALESGVSAKNGEYFTEQVLLGVIRNKTFKVVERKDLQKVLAEWKLNLQAVDETSAVKVGKLLGANLLLNSKIYKNKNNYEIYIKLINTETGEIQSATKLVVDTKLGI